jgi:hypothetical protein
MEAMVRQRGMLESMLCPSKPDPIRTVQTACGGVPVIAAITQAMDAHNMITTIMNTAA